MDMLLSFIILFSSYCIGYYVGRNMRKIIRRLVIAYHDVHATYRIWLMNRNA